jgi:hypothetical protein
VTAPADEAPPATPAPGEGQPDLYPLVGPHGQRCGLLSEVNARWGESQRKIAREVAERHALTGIVRRGNDFLVTRWHVRVIATWVANILRCDANELRELIALADALPRPRAENVDGGKS